MEKEHKEQGWKKIKIQIERRQRVKALVPCDNMDLLIMQRELLDKLIRYKELREQVRSFSEPPERPDPEEDLTLEEKLFYARKCCQIYQEAAFTCFIQNMFCGFIELMDNDSKRMAGETAEESIHMLFEFLEKYNSLLEQEYDRYRETVEKTDPPEH